ncbi:hypothetical protein Bca101_089302 [Brassica carinata]
MDYIRRSNIIKISGLRRIVTELEIELPTYPRREIKSERSSIIIISKEMSISLVLSKTSASSVLSKTPASSETSGLVEIGLLSSSGFV